ncbi:uncharacterized protein LOC109546659 [Dendroctonus ponderosae]|uniref:Uncharacterized protein n=1 Tax=Dendroctonus ponderosae TaxID=77166 RepID=A0AAR5QJD9_DENPD|nr:uncharacterized protein LOC109546659 [Dendroctonus ponderosae]KAH1009145.1 hypothetical protein HUJ04_001553 [Dendroctonus ponderosae]KAH1017100.1 hypothetical protein HUJ05_007815 [Dendroctonus ponderosae]
MVFVCPTKEESEAISQMSSKMRDALQQIEKELSIKVKPICVPCCVPLCDYPSASNEKNDIQKEFDPPQVMVCYRETCKKSKGINRTPEQEQGVIRLQQSKSRELRASILYTGCLCEKRDGLQDDCPRTGCHGSPECLTRPPTCGPSEFCDGKHLGKNNKYSRLSKKNGKNSRNENAEEHKNHKHLNAKYKCFPATVDQPIVIPLPQNPPCCPCP